MIYELKDKLETLKEETLYEIITKIRDIINEYWIKNNYFNERFYLIFR